MSHFSSHIRMVVAGCSALFLMAGCGSTMPSLGTNKGTVTGAAGGESSTNGNSQLERCSESLGTMSVQENTASNWYQELRSHNLGSTVPVLRMMIQQSNCFVIVDRASGLNDAMRERALDQSGEMRANNNFGKGQMVSADYTMSPSIQFSGQTAGGTGVLGVFGNNVFTRTAGSVGRNEASTTLLLVDNRSSVQISAAEGTASNFDFGIMNSLWGSDGYASAGGYAKTPQGKVIISAFADSFNQMVRALRNYKAQTVRGGLGSGGRLGVDGGSTSASRELSTGKR